MPHEARYTVLITDLVDSTKLTAELGDQRMVQVWMAHDRVARDLLPIYQGREIDKSDGFLILFDRPLDGVRYALAYHRGLRRLSAELGLRLLARAGLYEGELSLIRTPERDIAHGAKQWEAEGLAKPVAARIMSVALGGQTLLAGPTRALITEPSPLDGEGDPIRFISHGHYRMKGVHDPMELYEAAVAGAPMQPPPDSAKVYRVAPDEAGGWRPVAEVPNNLPPPRLGFFGREPELRAIGDLFDGGARLVTLAGPGGIGKTALSQRYGLNYLGDWTGGAWLVDLVEARSALDISRALGAALLVPLDQGDPVGVLGAALRARGRAVVLLDNFEQVVQHAAGTVGRWLDLAPEACFLVTSRQRLGLAGERLVPVDPLPLPAADASVEQLQENPSAALFLDRARAVQPDLRLDHEQAAAIARLVRLLDGLPLAIELAAARVRVLPPTGILDRMGRRFDLLRGGHRGASDRQGTLRGAIDWSWDLLDRSGRSALAQLSVFEGGFDLEAAEAVLDLSDAPDAPWAMDVVESLVEHSLVRSAPDRAGQTRFSLLQSIREYAAERLSDPTTRASLEARHTAWYARWGAQEVIDANHLARAQRQRLALDLDNIVAAARRAAGEPSALAALGAVVRLQESGPFALAIDLLERALQGPISETLRARLLIALVVVRSRAGQVEAEPPTEALTLARRLGQARLEADALAAMGQTSLLRGALDEAKAHHADALALYRQLRDARGEADALAELAHVIGIRGGQLDEALGLLDQALALHTRRGDEAGLALCSSYLGALRAIRGEFEPALEAYARARDLARVVGDRRTEGLSEGMIAAVLGITERAGEARAHFEAALRVQGSIGDRVHEAMHATNYGDVLARLGEDAAARRWLEHAIGLAIETGTPATEGAARSALGWSLYRTGSPELALEQLTAGEARLREAGDLPELAKLLCNLGQVELALGQRGAAAARRDEAEALAERLGLGPGSELVRMIAVLNEGLG
jgi:predicted ATPase